MDQTAEILVEIANKNYLRGDKTAYFSILTGTDGCKLENIHDGGQDYQTIIDTIHSYYRKHPSPGNYRWISNRTKSNAETNNKCNRITKFFENIIL